MKALLLIDIQNDFCKGGALAVPDGDGVVSIANLAIEKFDHVIASQDWHPSSHLSFASNNDQKKPGDMAEVSGLQQIMWPDHCVQNTKGAEFHPELNTAKIQKVVQKGTIREIDSYSAFFDNGHKNKTELDEYLKDHQITELHIMGLATDYCVKFTVLDAVDLGYKVTLIENGCRGIDLSSGDIYKALSEMRDAGVNITSI